MMSETKALALAAQANVAVGKTVVTKLEGRFCAKRGKAAVRYEVKVGKATCFYETDKGGSACWMVELVGAPKRAGYKGEAIAEAVRLQAA